MRKAIAVALVAALCISLITAVGVRAQSAETIIAQSGVKGGLVVHLGCGDGRLTAALRANESYVVHGLDPDPAAVQQARAHIQSLGLYGKVAVEHWTSPRLPYADNMVDLVVAEKPGQVSLNEIMRVLVPNGVAYLNNGGQWTKQIKPRPQETDEWTHYMHDATNNAVAHDELVGPPRRLQWTSEPPHTRSHEHTPSINAVVSCNGRIFYIHDEGPIGAVQLPPAWHLVARDAFNGILLWQRPITTWYPHIVNWGGTPVSLQRRLVAIGDRVYVTLGFHAPLSVLDAATGNLLKTYDNTEGTEEVIWHNGILLVSVRSVTDERVAQLQEMARLSQQKGSPLYTRDTATPFVDRFRNAGNKAETKVLALDADTGRLLWSKDAPGLRTLSLCADGDRVFYQSAENVICADLKTGQQRWSASGGGPLRLVYRDSVICATGRRATALSVNDGATRWTQDIPLTEIRDAFVASGSLWLGGFKPLEGARSPAWGPYFVTQHDLATGKLLREIQPENPSHHHRCYMNKATDRYILGGRRGTEFIDLQSGEVLWHSWARGVCRYGVMPANGLLYTPAHACGCYVGAKLTGFNALASGSPRLADIPTEPAQVERGPAYDSAAPSRAASAADWPTYRCDAQRSGSAQTPGPRALAIKWRAQVAGKLTSLTAADGKVFVASVDEHRVCAVDADSGQLLWQFTAGGRVDSPPTLHQGRAIFGSHDGYVYSLRTSDGALAWRLRVAPAERRIVARGQVESAWPVLGSVLLDADVICCTAGRSSYLDGGIDLCRLEPQTGRLLSQTRIYSPDPETGKQPKQFGPAAMPGARADILSADDNRIYLRDMAFDKQGNNQPDGNAHLFTLTDFLDDTWPHRSYWIFGTRCSLATGCSVRDKNLIYGRILSFDKSTIYGYGRKTVHWSNQLEDGAYRLFAVKRDDGSTAWEKTMPIHIRAMALAGNTLFVAGPSTDAGQAAGLMAISASDGSVLAQQPLDASPIQDALVVANGRLYISLDNGQVVCFG